MESTTTLPSVVEGVRPGQHVVYWLCARIPVPDKDGLDLVVVYVGVTSNLSARLAAHRRTKWWWKALDLSETQVEHHATRAEANAAEVEWITLLKPAMNIAGRIDACALWEVRA
jgi:hypothetical protein